MPELPEVETVARQLQRRIRGRQFLGAMVFDRKLKLDPKPLIGAVVKRVFRVGKYVVLECAPDTGKPLYAAVHLRMTGRLLWKGDAKGSERERRIYVHELPDSEKYQRAAFKMTGGTLLFCDARRFGTFKLYDALPDLPVKGVDPLSKDFTLEFLRTGLSKRKQPMKQWLLRQDCIAGIGNIYASEILFRARISPRRAAGRVKEHELELLMRSIRAVLSEAIAKAGTSFSDFQDSEGKEGSFERFLRVYGREGEACCKCRSEVRRIVQVGRSTFFCKSCQR